MSIWAAISALLAVIVAINLLITAGIVRRLRTLGAVSPALAEYRPSPGFSVDLKRELGWPDEARELLVGDALVIFSLPGCAGCERLRRDLGTSARIVALYLILDRPVKNGQRDRYAAMWAGTPTVIDAPRTIDLLDSFDRPREFPTVVLLRDGVVVASGNSLAAVDKLIPKRELPMSAGSVRYP